MAEGWVLIDTSVWIHALRPTGNPRLRDHVRHLLAEGRGATCEMIVLELAGGARRERESRELSEDLEALKQLRTTETVWRLAYRMAHTLRSKGLSIPAADVLITAVAVNYGCHLLHDDNHFDLMARHVALAVWKR